LPAEVLLSILIIDNELRVHITYFEDTKSVFLNQKGGYKLYDSTCIRYLEWANSEKESTVEVSRD
jgi:hypothetical protein